MGNNRELLKGLKPIYDTVIFEIKKQRKKFYFFLALTFIVAIIIAVTVGLMPSSARPETSEDLFFVGLTFIIFIEVIAASMFFSGIICSEFDKKTGFIVFPKINKYKLILGKYLGNLILVITLSPFLGFIFFYLLVPFQANFFGSTSRA